MFFDFSYIYNFYNLLLNIIAKSLLSLKNNSCPTNFDPNFKYFVILLIIYFFMKTCIGVYNKYLKQSLINNNIKKIKIDDRMKLYESMQKQYIKPYESYIVRLDGNCFSKFTKNIKKIDSINEPFDLNFIKAMTLTIKDLHKKFSSNTSYTHSDEITLIFSKKCTKDEYNNSDKSKKIPEHIFNGNHQKIISLYASYTSIRFNYHLTKLINMEKDKYPKNLIDILNDTSQIFDARIITFDEKTEYEILNHQIWRSVRDCYRNAVSTYATLFKTEKELLYVNTDQKIKLIEQNNIDWSKIPIYHKYGIYCKKQLIKTNEITRTKYICNSFKLKFNENNLNLLLDAYWYGNEKNIDLYTELSDETFSFQNK